MKKYAAFISAIVLAIFVSATAVQAAGGVGSPIPPKEITKEDAAKKYPPPNGKSYPSGVLPDGVSTSAEGAGLLQSPYSSKVYQVKGIKHGAFLLDESVNKVFIRP
jgi:hypothetical protein